MKTTFLLFALAFFIGIKNEVKATTIGNDSTIVTEKSNKPEMVPMPGKPGVFMEKATDTTSFAPFATCSTQQILVRNYAHRTLNITLGSTQGFSQTFVVPYNNNALSAIFTTTGSSADLGFYMNSMAPTGETNFKFTFPTGGYYDCTYMGTGETGTGTYILASHGCGQYTIDFYDSVDCPM